MASSLRILCAGAAVLWAAAGLAGEASAAPAAPAAEVDVVVDTGLLTPPDHRQSYLESMRAYARECLGGLVPPEPHPAGTPPRAGAARYRLFVEHRGKVEVDAVAAPAELVGENQGEARQWITRQKGTIRFRLGRWDGSGYPTVDQWSSTFQTEHFLPMPADASVEERAQYQRAARNLATPEGVKSGILDRLLPVKLAKTAGKPGSPQAMTLAVTNRSRWTLTHLDIAVTWCAVGEKDRHRYQGEVTFDGRLEPGAQVELKGVAEPAPSIFGWEYTLPTQIEARPVFEPGG